MLLDALIPGLVRESVQNAKNGGPSIGVLYTGSTISN